MINGKHVLRDQFTPALAFTDSAGRTKLPLAFQGNEFCLMTPFTNEQAVTFSNISTGLKFDNFF